MDADSFPIKEESNEEIVNENGICLNNTRMEEKKEEGKYFKLPTDSEHNAHGLEIIRDNQLNISVDSTNGLGIQGESNVDSYPEIHAIIKNEDNSCQSLPENEKVDIFLQSRADSIDIKYEFPEMAQSPPKKRRRCPPSSKKALRKPDPATSFTITKPCTVKLTRLRVSAGPNILTDSSKDKPCCSKTIQGTLDSDEINLLKPLPLLHNYLGKQGLIKCRTICKEWKNAVDNYLTNYFLNITREDIKLINNFLYSFPIELFANGDLQQRMSQCPMNPFIGHAIHLRLITKEKWPSYHWKHSFDELINERRASMKQVRLFLETFGVHIFTLYIEGDWDEELPFITHDFSLLLPNLKSLLIGPSSNLGDIKKCKIAAEMKGNALLNLERLEVFDIPLKVRNLLMTSLSKSRIKELHYQVDHPNDISFINFGSLKELHVRRVNELTTACKIYLEAPQLELLGLDMDFLLKDENSAFKTLLKGQPNLHTLRLYLTTLWAQNQWYPNILPECLKCPKNIKTLEIYEGCFEKVTFGITNYSFLTRFSHVKRLKIVQNTTRNYIKMAGRLYEEVEVHQFLYVGRMYESNIWEKMPSLQELTFGRKIYKRSSFIRNPKLRIETSPAQAEPSEAMPKSLWVYKYVRKMKPRPGRCARKRTGGLQRPSASSNGNYQNLKCKWRRSYLKGEAAEQLRHCQQCPGKVFTVIEKQLHEKWHKKMERSKSRSNAWSRHLEFCREFSPTTTDQKC